MPFSTLYYGIPGPWLDQGSSISGQKPSSPAAETAIVSLALDLNDENIKSVFGLWDPVLRTR